MLTVGLDIGCAAARGFLALRASCSVAEDGKDSDLGSGPSERVQGCVSRFPSLCASPEKLPAAQFTYFFTWGNIASVYKFMALWGIHVAFIESSSEVL